MKKKYLYFILFGLSNLISTSAQNLLNNGNFESGGNGVGFNINSSFYNAISPPFSGNTNPGNYAVTSNPQPMNTIYFISGGDHTTGTGNMLVVDATTTGGGQRFWRAGNNGDGACGLTIGVTYTFSYWIKSVSTQVTNTATRADIRYQFNNASNITLISGSALAPLPINGWQQVVYTFTPTNNCVNLELWDNNTNDTGNDFAVDDFELYGPPQPLTLTYSAVNPSCPGANDGYIIGYGAGANPPYFYYLTGPVTASNASGVFSGLPAGTYSLRVLEAADGEITINSIVLADPQDLTVSAAAAICAGENTTLSVSGSSTGYNWTASPADKTLVDTASASPTVSPAQTTTYTVTSTSSSSTNLVFNGNFSAGNIGFQSDYVYYTPNNPTGIQRAYGIVTNSNAWESGFSSCGDHTSGTGKMMVVDGSIINGGNDKVWCQTIAVAPNQNYTFSYWIQTVAGPTPARIDIVINGIVIGSALAPPAIPICNWQPRSYVWNSGTNTTAQICMYDRETVLMGNDFAIDDLSFVGPNVVCNLSKSITVTVNNSITPSFEPVTPICSGQVLAPLPTTSAENISGTWQPALNNTATTTYTFTPNANQCASTTTLEIAVVNGNIIPTFNAVTPICVGGALDALPTTSLNNISGTWSPALDNQTTTIYTFTPDPNQCATSTSLQIIVNSSEVTPSFNFGAVETYCQGTPIDAPLPGISSNGISGTWNLTGINTQQLGTSIYTFTPFPNQCATNFSFTANIIESITPTFAPVSPICLGEMLAPLPAFSLNNVGGIWTPELNNNATTTYTFTPKSNICASTTTLEIVVNNNVTPIFDLVGAACIGSPLQPLPTNSLNNITGSWSPAINNMTTTTYTFTPDPNQCASSTTLTIVIIPANIITSFNFGNAITSCLQSVGEVPPILLPSTDENGIPGIWTPESINYSVLGESVYTFRPVVNTCASNFVLTVNIIKAPEFTINAGCIGDNFVLSTATFEIKENGNFTWYNEQNEVISTNSSVIITSKGTYKVVKEVNGCRSEQTVEVPSVYCKIQKGISPNDDNLNDFFDLSNLSVTELQIFNRYGTEVYRKKNYTNEWDGRTNSGNQLPDGTYFYVINFETGKSKTGWIYVNKEY